MQKKKIRITDMIILILGFSLTVGAGFVLYQEFSQNTISQGSEVATIKETRGKVEVRPEGQPFWRPATPNLMVNKGDRIRTDSGASASLKWKTGDELKIDQSSIIVVSDPKEKESFKIELGTAVQKPKSSAVAAATPPPTPTPPLAPTPSFEIRKADTKEKIVYTEKSKEQKIILQKPEPNQVIEASDLKATDVPLFWKSTMDGQFQVEVSRSPDFSQPLLNERTRKNFQSISLPANLAAGTYYWRVVDTQLPKTMTSSEFQVIQTRPPKFITGSPITLGPSDLEKATAYSIKWSSEFAGKQQVKVTSLGKDSIYEVDQNEYVLNLADAAKTTKLILTNLQVRSLTPAQTWTHWSDPLLVMTTGTETLKISALDAQTTLLPSEKKWTCANPSKIILSNMVSGRTYHLLLTQKSQAPSLPPQISTSEPEISISTDKKETDICPPTAGTWAVKAIEFNPQFSQYRQSNSVNLSARLDFPEISSERTRFLSEKTLSFGLTKKTPPQPIEIWAMAQDKTEKYNFQEPTSPQLMTLNSEKHWWLRARYLDREDRPITDWGPAVSISKFTPPKPVIITVTPTPTPPPPLEMRPIEERMTWNVRDSGPIYSAEAPDKPWTWLMWTTSPRPQKFEYQISTRPDFKTILKSENTTNSKIIFTFESQQKLYWRVRGTLNGKTTNWSDIRMVETQSLRIPANSGGGTR